jgi:hypothetical protein
MQLRSCLVVVLVGMLGCGAKAPPTPPPPSNVSPPPKAEPAPPPEEKPATFGVSLVPNAPGGPSVKGVLRDARDQSPLAGSTVVLEAPTLNVPITLITDLAGNFTAGTLASGRYTLTAYYADHTAQTTIMVEQGKRTMVSLDWDLAGPTERKFANVELQGKHYTIAKDALAHGLVEDAVMLADQELAKSPSSQLHAMLALARYGVAIDVFHADLPRHMHGPHGPNVKELRATLTKLASDLDGVQAALAEAAKDPQFSLELCVACMTENGAMGLPPGALDIERDRAGKPLPEGDARRRPTFRFDHGDLAWGRAMVSYQQAILNVLLAYDWSWVDAMIAAQRPPQDGDKITIAIAEPARIAAARHQIFAGLRFSDEARTAYLKETDDDREWVPNPKQTSYGAPLPVDAKLYKTWEQVIGDVRELVDGKTGISLAAVWKLLDFKGGGPTGFIDVGAMFTSPKPIVIEVGMIDRLEIEKDAKEASKLATQLLKDVVGNGYKPKMKASKLTDRLLLLRKELDKGGGDAIEDKLKYVLWLN